MVHPTQKNKTLHTDMATGREKSYYSLTYATANIIKPL